MEPLVIPIRRPGCSGSEESMVSAELVFFGEVLGVVHAHSEDLYVVGAVKNVDATALG